MTLPLRTIAHRILCIGNGVNMLLLAKLQLIFNHSGTYSSKGYISIIDSYNNIY